MQKQLQPDAAVEALFIALGHVDRTAALRALVAYKGVNQLQVAKASGLHHSAVSRLLRHGVAGAEACDAMLRVGVPRELLPMPRQDERAA